MEMSAELPMVASINLTQSETSPLVINAQFTSPVSQPASPPVSPPVSPRAWGSQSVFELAQFSNVDRFDEVFAFRNETPLIRRRQLFNKIKQAHPDRVPLIVAIKRPRQANGSMIASLSRSLSGDSMLRALDSGMMTLTKTKFLVPNEMTFGAFQHHLRSHLRNFTESQALFLFLESSHTLAPGSSLMSTLWDRYQDKRDGFLYVIATEENVYG
jgi:hypothetical protein